MQINTVTAVLTFSVFALMHQSIPPPQPLLPRATAARGGGGGGYCGGWAQMELTDA